MLEAKHDNMKTTFASSSTKLSKVEESILDSWIWQSLVHHLTINDT
jgi:hypothetical protein